MYNDSQQFILLPLLHGFSSCMVTNVKIIQTAFYQQQPHEYFNLIILFNEILIRNFSDVQFWNSLRMIQMYRNK